MTMMKNREERDKQPYGPMESDLAVHLIGTEILYARDKEGLGSYGTLVDINFGDPEPYIITNERIKRGKVRWIVKH